jgi:hypothetical protein
MNTAVNLPVYLKGTQYEIVILDKQEGDILSGAEFFWDERELPWHPISSTVKIFNTRINVCQYDIIKPISFVKMILTGDFYAV